MTIITRRHLDQVLVLNLQLKHDVMLEPELEAWKIINHIGIINRRLGGDIKC